MRRRILTAAAAAAVLSMVFGGCVGDWAFFDASSYKYRFEDSFAADLTGAEELFISIINGPIKIKTWDQDRVEIEVHERVKAPDDEKAKELADAVKLTGNLVGTRYEITLDFGEFYNKRNNYYCALDVKLPARLALDLETTNGEIEIPEMEGKVRAETTNGNVDLRGCKGDADLKTTNGSVTTGLIGGKLYAGTTNGNLKLKTNGEVRGRSTNGNITARIMLALTGDVDLSTTNGSIDLEIHPDSSFRLEAGTTNGHVGDSLNTDRFRGEYNRRRTELEGNYGDGKYNVTLSTTNGSISIDESIATETKESEKEGDEQ